jgi:hypothetical protein
MGGFMKIAHRHVNVKIWEENQNHPWMMNKKSKPINHRPAKSNEPTRSPRKTTRGASKIRPERYYIPS